MSTFRLNVLIPYRRIELLSPLSAHAVQAVLSDVVESKRWFQKGSPRRIFEGEVTDYSFEFQRIISYRNAFLPQIRGAYAPHDLGSKVLITMRPHWTVFVFMTVWFGGIGAAVIASCVAAVRYGGLTVVMGIPLGMLVLGCVFFGGAFSFEATQAERILTQLMLGTRTDPANRNEA